LAGDLLATLDREGRFTALNPAWERTLGFSHAELLGTRAVDLLHPADLETTLALNNSGSDRVPDVVEFENRYRCKDGGFRWLQWNARLVDGTWYTVARDVTDNRRLEVQAARDPLTGLANRATAMQRLEWAVRRLERRPGLVGVLFVDLDHFKVINDARGHELGDRFLCAAAERLRETVRSVDGVARFGGDEFVVVIEDLSDVSEVVEVARRVVAALARSIVIDDDETTLGASVGVAVTEDPGQAPEVMLREADHAMYKAKAEGGGCYQVFEEALREAVE
jgi:diguanylate cyclase (GGDEF)-like protein/PAS domain S-box-containing protein